MLYTVILSRNRNLLEHARGLMAGRRVRNGGLAIGIESSKRRQVTGRSGFWRGDYRTIKWIESSSRRQVTIRFGGTIDSGRGGIESSSRRQVIIRFGGTTDSGRGEIGYSDGFRWRWSLWAHRNRRSRNDGGWTIRFLLRTTCPTFYSIQPRKGDADDPSTCDC